MTAQLGATKVCPQCKVDLPRTLEYFPKQSQCKDGMSPWCRPCAQRKKAESNARIRQSDPEAWAERRRGYVAAYKERHPDRVKQQERRQMLRSKFGMTPEEYDSLLDSQGGVCALCDAPPGKKMLAVDHDHESGAVRSLLCSKCNTALGLFNDNVNLLAKAVSYLERHSNVVGS